MCSRKCARPFVRGSSPRDPAPTKMLMLTDCADGIDVVTTRSPPDSSLTSELTGNASSKRIDGRRRTVYPARQPGIAIEAAAVEVTGCRSRSGSVAGSTTGLRVSPSPPAAVTGSCRLFASPSSQRPRSRPAHPLSHPPLRIPRTKGPTCRRRRKTRQSARCSSRAPTRSSLK